MAVPATASSKVRAGKGSRVTAGVANTVLQMSEWEVTDRVDDLEFVTFESNGFEEGEAGVNVVDLRVGGQWNAGRNFLDDPPGIYPRADLPNVRLFTQLVDAISYFFPYSRVLSARITCPVRQLVGFEWSGKSQGSFTRPTGSL